MSGSVEIHVKRKREEAAPDTLVYKRVHANEEPDHLRYFRRASISKDSLRLSGHGRSQISQQTCNSPGKPGQSWKRTFHLSKPQRAGSSKKDYVPIFSEWPGQITADADRQRLQQQPVSNFLGSSNAEPLKRPGKRAAVQHTMIQNIPVTATTASADAHLERIATDLHLFALEGLANQRKPKVTSIPRLSAAQSRDIHRQRLSASEVPREGRDKEMSDSGDYVYDTYILAPAEDERGAETISGLKGGEVGFLVIGDADHELWEAYMEEDQGGENGFDTDEEDENAEDYWGAEYPEDELASDDEYNRDPYRFRGLFASDEEEWDENTGAYSDDEDDRTTNVWR